LDNNDFIRNNYNNYNNNNTEINQVTRNNEENRYPYQIIGNNSNRKINDFEGYKIIKISYIDEDNQIRYMDQLVPNYFNSQSQILLNPRNNFNNLYNSEQKRISTNNSNNNSRNISSKLIGNILQNNPNLNKNSRFSNNEIPSIIDEEYINNRIKKAEIIYNTNEYNTQLQNENNHNNNNNLTRRDWYTFKCPSLNFKCPTLSFKCPKINIPKISIPSCKI